MTTIRTRNRLPGYMGGEGCSRCGQTPTRFYGEDVWTGDFLGFTGWRGPYCSTTCYREDHDDPNILADLAWSTARDTRPVRPASA